MITGINKTKAEQKYRAIDKDSSSSLKDFSLDRRKYYKKYVLHDKVDEKENLAANMGKLVETLLLEPEEFDNRFYMSSCASPPTGLMLDFVEALYKVTSEATDGFGVVTRDFAEVVEDAYQLSGFKIPKEQVLKKFAGSNAEIYYREIREVRSRNLTIVTTQEVNNAEKIIEELRTNEFTKDIINQESTIKNITVHNQYKIDSYTCDGHEFKSMLDKVIINHKTKTVHLYDLKCVWSVEGFYADYYLFRRAYIQAYLYYTAMVQLSQQEDCEFYGYTVEYLKFIVVDSINYYKPLIYTLSTVDMSRAYNGFRANGRVYPGVKELIEDLKWAQENDVWTISKKNFESKGIVNLRTNGT